MGGSMKDRNWVILKSAIFELRDASLGNELDSKSLLNNSFVDYCCSHENLKALASFLLYQGLALKQIMVN